MVAVAGLADSLPPSPLPLPPSPLPLPPQGTEDVSREDSFQLLQEGLKGGVASREQLLKTQQAIVVLYARHVLASLLAHWPHPPHPRISTSFLGNIDIMQLFCLLDLLMKPLKHKACSDVSFHGNSNRQSDR